MSAKKSELPASHDAAQKRVWKADLKSLEASRRKVGRDFDAARKPLYKAFLAARRKLDAFDTREEKLRPRAVAKIDRRIGILKGRIGI
jgi:hypothetical protein